MSSIFVATSSASGDVVGPGSSTDNAVARFDGTTGKLLQNSSITIGDLTSNKVIITSPSVAGTATKVEIVGGASSQAGTVGGDLRLGGGAGGTGAEKGVVMILGTANSTGNRPCLVVETDGVGYFGYNYAAGGYGRFGNAYFKSGIELRESGGSGSGMLLSQDGSTPTLAFFRSTASSGMNIQNLYHSVLGIYTQGGTLAFNFGRWDGSGSNFGEFWLMKSSGANLKWNTDGAGDIGSASADRPNNIYAVSGLGIGTSGALGASEIAKFVSTSKGITLPKPTSDASIGTPVEAMLIYDDTANKLKFYNGTGWETVTSA